MKDLITFKYNQIGIVHNLTLDAITKLKDFPNVSDEAAYYMGIKTQNSLFSFHCNEVQYPDFEDIKLYYDLIPHGGYNRVIKELLKNKKISKLLATEMEQYFHKIENVQNHEELTKVVSDFIKHFKHSSQLTEEEIIICWGVASVTLFSYNYWNDAFFNPSNPWYDVVSDNSNSPQLKKGRFWRIVFVILADCAGILLGGLVGSIFGPAGAVAGAGATGAAASAAAGKN